MSALVIPLAALAFFVGMFIGLLQVFDPSLQFYACLIVILVSFYVAITSLRERVGTLPKSEERRRELIERLAALEHEQWCRWSKQVAYSERLTKTCMRRWVRLWVPYDRLPEAKKELDRIEARKVLDALERSPVKRWRW